MRGRIFPPLSQRQAQDARALAQGIVLRQGMLRRVSRADVEGGSERAREIKSLPPYLQALEPERGKPALRRAVVRSHETENSHLCSPHATLGQSLPLWLRFATCAAIRNRHRLRFRALHRGDVRLNYSHWEGKAKLQPLEGKLTVPYPKMELSALGMAICWGREGSGVRFWGLEGVRYPKPVLASPGAS